MQKRILKSEMKNKLKRGDIFLVRFHPSFGRELKKYRPAVVVSSRYDSRFVTIVPFTSSQKIIHTSAEMIVTNSVLQTPSVLLSWYLMTIDVSRLEYQLGTLSRDEMRRMKQQLSNVVR